MTINKQIADVYFDRVEQVYRASIEYYAADRSPIGTINIEFPGSISDTFAEIEQAGFKKADEALSRMIAG